MYAIVDIKDKQFKVQEDDTIFVPHHPDAEVDDTITLDRVLLVSDGNGDIQLGGPHVDDASVSARVMDQVKGDKVIVFKKKRRKRYRVKRGHRQQYTKIQIESLNLGANDAVQASKTASKAETAESSESADTETEAEDDA